MLGNVSNEVANKLAPMGHIRRAIRNQRERQCSHGIPVIPKEYRITMHGDGFLLHDSGPGDPSRMIIFATDAAFEILSSSDPWFGDGTFEVSQFIFFQLYTIHDIRNGRLIPCTFALLPNKRQVTYDRLFGEIMQHMLGHIPTDFLMDIEKAATNSAANAFIGSLSKSASSICLAISGRKFRIVG